MIRMLRADLVRLTTLRSSYVVPLILFALVAGITAASLADAGSEGMTTSTQLREPLTASAGIMVAVAMALFAAMRVAGDYRYDTMAQRILASPRRSRLIRTTFVFHGLLGLAVAAVALVIGMAIAVPMLAGKDREMDMTVATMAAVLFAGAAFSLIGVCCAVLFRSQAAATLVLVGAFFVEKLVGIFIGDAAAYLPYGLLTPLLRLEGATTSVGAAAVALGAITLALVTLAFVVFDRRDVTP